MSSAYISINDYKSGKLKHKINMQKSGSSIPVYMVKHVIQSAVKATLYNENVDRICVVNILLTNDKGIRKYNMDYRGIDRATDVLSFPMQDFSKTGWSGCCNLMQDEDTGFISLGDIVVSSETIQRHSNEYRNSIVNEWAYMIIHSTLHLLGYDHDNEINEKVMSNKSNQIMQRLGFNKNDK